MDVPGAGSDRAPVEDASWLALEYLDVAGMRLRVGHLRPPADARGTVLVLPGRAEFIEKYGEVLATLRHWNYAAAILDWRGQGGSDRFLSQRHRGHVAQVDDYLLDLAALTQWIDRLGLPGPHLILAHSMGAHVALRHLRTEPGRFAGAALIAPMFGIHLAPTPEPLARAICDLADRLGVAARYAPGQRDFVLERYVFARNRLTSSPERHALLRQHVATCPELALGGVTYGWLGAALRSIQLIRRPGYLEAITTPILVCQAGRERIVSNRAQVAVVRRLPRARLVRFPEGRHELLMERDEIRDRVLEVIADFFAEVSR